MTSTHRLSLPAHGAAELLVGLALLALPFALGLNAAALLIGAGAGVVVAGVGLAGGESLSVRAHLALDQAVVAVLAGAALALALAGERPAALLLGLGALAECALVAGTRWSRRR